MHHSNQVSSARTLLAFVLALTLELFVVPAHAQPAPGRSGTVTGTVNNVATGRLLDGARVEIAALGRSVLTDGDGRFLFQDLPPGEHVVTVSYEGLDAYVATVRIPPGGSTTLRIDLTAGIYRLDTFKVTGEREGTAAAITAQRNADNVKHIVAVDTYGIMPNMGGGELAIRLPGVAGTMDDDFTVSGLVVRGMAPSQNRITVDGGAVPPTGSLSRGFQAQFVTTAMFDQVEVIKGHTPDKGADSLGGTLNFKTRSALSRKEKRVFDYNVGAIWAPSFTEQTTLRRSRAIAPLASASYSEIFGVFGGDRNFGVALNLLYSEKVIGYYSTIRDFQNTPASPAYTWDYRTQDDLARRFQTNVNLRMDYRLSQNSKFSLNASSQDHIQPTRDVHLVRAFTSQTVATVGTNGQLSAAGAILPDYTDAMTRVRGLAASTITVSDTALAFLQRIRGLSLGGEHEFGAWQMDYNLAYHQNHTNLTSGDGAGTFTHQITGVGWILDRTRSDLYPQFVQTEGPDFSNPANYRIASADVRHIKRLSSTEAARVNVRYTIKSATPVFLKAGGDLRKQESGNIGGNRRWTYVGTQPLLSNSNYRSTAFSRTGSMLPTWESPWYFHNNQPRDPSLWQENVYFREQSRYTTTSEVSETVSAGYVMGQSKYKGLGLLSGVRMERTDVESFGRVRARSGSTLAQQASDPIGAAARDYENTARRIAGNYTKSFPSAHLTYAITPQVKAHLSWSTSFARPEFTNLLPNETFNDTQRTLTINNPALKPQTAKNWDATLDYYLPVGMFSLGGFHKQIADYIVTGINAGTVGVGPNNGYDGEFEGYDILTSGNAGNAVAQGVEFSYLQELTFLPRPFNGLGINANFTYLRTHGNYGSATPRGRNELAGFIPQTGNLNLTYKYRAFSSRILINYTGRYISSFTAPNSPRNEYREVRTVVNVGLGWQLRRGANLFCEIMNVFNEPQRRFRGWESRMSYQSIGGTQFNFGVTGRF